MKNTEHRKDKSQKEIDAPKVDVFRGFISIIGPGNINNDFLFSSRPTKKSDVKK